jgi:1-acyl-sn-glycerol-3-phosphate acyltransferase
MGHIWTLLMAPVGFVFTMGICVSICICGLFDRTGWAWWRLSRFWGWGMVRLGGATGGVVTRNIEKLSNLKGAILMANHESNLDPPLLIGLSPQPVRFVTKQSLFYVPLFGQAMWVLGMIPVDRGRRDRAIQALEQAAEKIAQGRVVLVFPEGTRSPDGEVARFKKGGFMLALQAGVPIIPIGIAGTRQLLSPGDCSVRFGQAAVSVGEPILTAGLDTSDRQAIMDQVRAAISVEREAARALLVT